MVRSPLESRQSPVETMVKVPPLMVMLLVLEEVEEKVSCRGPKPEPSAPPAALMPSS